MITDPVFLYRLAKEHQADLLRRAVRERMAAEARKVTIKRKLRVVQARKTTRELTPGCSEAS